MPESPTKGDTNGQLEQVTEEGTLSVDKNLKQLSTDNVELTTSDACPSEELDEIMEIGKDASPVLTTSSAAPTKQRKTVASER